MHLSMFLVKSNCCIPIENNIWLHVTITDKIVGDGPSPLFTGVAYIMSGPRIVLWLAHLPSTLVV